MANSSDQVATWSRPGRGLFGETAETGRPYLPSMVRIALMLSLALLAVSVLAACGGHGGGGY